jgi:hypothetical protein
VRFEYIQPKVSGETKVLRELLLPGMVSFIWYSIQKFVYWGNYNNFIFAVVTWWYCPIKAVIFGVYTLGPVPLLLLQASLELPFCDALHTASDSASVSAISVILHHFNWIFIFLIRADLKAFLSSLA